MMISYADEDSEPWKGRRRGYLRQPLRHPSMVRTGPLSVLAEAIGAVLTKGSCASRGAAVGVGRRMNALTVAVRVVFVVAQRGNIQISRCVYNYLGNVPV